MARTQTYIPEIWAVDGEVVAIPQETQEDGKVSYQEGYGERYQLKQGVNPQALPYPRKQTNQIYNTLTGNQQSWMKYGLPIWTPAIQNLGVALAYPLFAQVWHSPTEDDEDGNTYQNLVNGNTAEPGTDATWLLTSGAVDGVQVGMVIYWTTVGSPDGRYLLADQSAVSRTTYSALYNKVCPIFTGNIENGNDLVTGISSTAEFHIGMKMEAAGIPVGATIIAIPGGTSVQMSADATATTTAVNIRFFVWGNGDGSTTFNIPAGAGKYIAGAGGSGIDWAGNTYSKVGQTFGEAEAEITEEMLPNHVHTYPTSDAGVSGFTLHKPGGGTDLGPGASYGVTSGTVTGGINGFTSQDPIPQIPPSAMYKFFVRY